MLVSTSKAADILGISLQGVHYRIKKGLLKSKKEDGKILVYVDDDLNTQQKHTHEATIASNDELLKAKDEQIELLKESISWMKNQYESQIKKLEENQDKIIDVFKSEIILLQQAYNEIREFHKIENKTKDAKINSIDKKENNIEFMDIKDFFEFMKKNGKTKEQTKKILLNQIKLQDKRFIYNSKTKDVIIYKSDFLDLI
jgi:DNA-binding transcriptional MerR regulator